jgi:hypothetical protein
MFYFLSFFGTYLIEVMAGLFVISMILRFFAYRSGKFANIYYSSFTRELELNVEKDKEENRRIKSVDLYLADLLGRVGKKLPERSLRMNERNEENKNKNNEKKTFTLREFVDGKQGLITNIQAESSVFHCKTPPNFTELTERIIEQDSHWMKMLRHLPIDEVSKIIDIMPGIFVVLGIFGTFIGITMALPEIANIDFNDLDNSAGVLVKFVKSVTFSMDTSIVGIFFSLIMTLLNTLFPIKGMRYRVFKKIETSLQMLYYHIHHDSAEQMIVNETFPKLLTVLERLEFVLSSKDKNLSDATGEINLKNLIKHDKAS